MGVAIPLQGGLLPLEVDTDGSSSQIGPLKFRVIGLAADEDATKANGIPQPGHSIVVGGVSYFADRARTRGVVNDGEIDVEVMYSTDGRFRFPARPINPIQGEREVRSTFRTEEFEAPTFVTEEVIIPTATGDISSLAWRLVPIRYQVDFSVLEVTTHWNNLSFQDYLRILSISKAQVGRLHQFRLDPTGPLEWWRFTPPSIQWNVQGRVDITFVWESDPGNGPIGTDVGSGSAPGHRRGAPARPPFMKYGVISSTGTGIPAPPPTVYLEDQFPITGNTYVVPNGWRTLPGSPLPG